jgi:hypothetical protein
MTIRLVCDMLLLSLVEVLLNSFMPRTLTSHNATEAAALAILGCSLTCEQFLPIGIVQYCTRSFLLLTISQLSFCSVAYNDTFFSFYRICHQPAINPLFIPLLRAYTRLLSLFPPLLLRFKIRSFIRDAPT